MEILTYSDISVVSPQSFEMYTFFLISIVDNDSLIASLLLSSLTDSLIFTSKNCELKTLSPDKWENTH